MRCPLQSQNFNPISKRVASMSRKIRLRVNGLEDRITPAELLHTLYPDPTGPQQFAQFGTSVAADAKYRVVGTPDAHVLGPPFPTNAGQVLVFDATTNNLVATLNNPTPISFDQFGYSVAVSDNYV